MFKNDSSKRGIINVFEKKKGTINKIMKPAEASAPLINKGKPKL